MAKLKDFNLYSQKLEPLRAAQQTAQKESTVHLNSNTLGFYSLYPLAQTNSTAGEYCSVALIPRAPLQLHKFKH